nr:MAG TPA: hypothetical protein [Caudoviricetes sp.]
MKLITAIYTNIITQLILSAIHKCKKIQRFC